MFLQKRRESAMQSYSCVGGDCNHAPLPLPCFLLLAIDLACWWWWGGGASCGGPAKKRGTSVRVLVIIQTRVSRASHREAGIFALDTQHMLSSTCSLQGRSPLGSSTPIINSTILAQNARHRKQKQVPGPLVVYLRYSSCSGSSQAEPRWPIPT